MDALSHSGSGRRPQLGLAQAFRALNEPNSPKARESRLLSPAVRSGTCEGGGDATRLDHLEHDHSGARGHDARQVQCHGARTHRQRKRERAAEARPAPKRTRTLRVSMTRSRATSPET